MNEFDLFEPKDRSIVALGNCIAKDNHNAAANEISNESIAQDDIKINEEYAKLLPKLNQKDYELLKDSIKDEGLYVALISNQNDAIIRPNKEYSELVPEVSNSDYEILKQSIKENGLLIPLVVNQNHTLLDGYHRLKACNELGIKPLISIRKFENSLEEKKFVIEVNHNRRHLTPFQRVELQYKLESIDAELCKEKI